MKLAAIILVTLVLVIGCGASPAQAADDTEHVISSRYLTLTSIGDEVAMGNLSPLVPVSWQIGVEAHPPTDSRIDIGISVTQPPGARGLQVDVRTCSVRWVSDLCSGAEGTWMWHKNLATAVTPVNHDGIHPLGWMPSTEQRWVLIQATLPANMPVGFTTDVHVHAWGYGDDVQSDGPSRLAYTGCSLGAPLGLAVTSVLVGLALAALARWRSTRRRAAASSL
jgi:signal peptidase